ncbi:uncharacterized protein BKA55DRAFT_535284 [Fusarium redolens]|uniref:Uncharacterized protein n=1 Tax=Fusarium redolens TaxID=48865 RepID=A0A9P9KNF7_FUSRE|nr:uncharacterized protein BKA55DRAFT_535284 [Fusarium redolens]KAH7265350.1 hypothetical protein BKA55DRAFT_535284 [Fusarium redolens]
MALHQDILPIPSPSMLYHGGQYQNSASSMHPEPECQAAIKKSNSAGGTTESPWFLCSAFRSQKVPGTRCPTCALAGKEVWIYPRVKFRLPLSWFKTCPKAQCQDVVEHFPPAANHRTVDLKCQLNMT